MTTERMSETEYLVRERAAQYKSEYREGRTMAMTGATRQHGVIAWNVGSALHAQMSGRPCAAFIADMRVKVAPTGLYTYPDMIALCAEPVLEDRHRDTLLNPTVIIEVLSPSTEAYDRGEKFDHYRRVESLREYVLIAQARMRVERYARDEADRDRWQVTELRDPDALLELDAIGCAVVLREIYERIELAPEV